MKDSLWRAVRDKLVEHLKGKAVRLALKKILGAAAMGGFKGWLVKFIVTELFEEVAEPLIKLAVRKGFLLYDKAEGAIKIKKLNEAKEDGNEEDYRTTIGSV